MAESTPEHRVTQTIQLTDAEISREVDDLLGSMERAFDAEHDPIRARRDRAAQNLHHLGILNPVQFAEIEPELSQHVSMELSIVRVIRMRMHAADGSQREATRIITGGYRDLPDGSSDAVVWAIDMEEGRRNGLPDDLRRTLAGFCPNLEKPEVFIAGDPRTYEQDIYELLVANGRHLGRPVRDLYRPAGEPAVSGVREIEPPQQRTDFGQAA